MKVAIIGTTGMLGSTLLKFFQLSKIKLIKSIRFKSENKKQFIDSLENADYIINCSGAIPQRKPNFISEYEEQKYYSINYLLPELLIENNFRVIQPCTDCVYKGDPKFAPYSLHSTYDSEEPYGKSKAKLFNSSIYLNKIDSIKVIRASIIGTDKLEKSLYSWVLSEAENSQLIRGYVNHFWNGITTLKWAEICLSIMLDFDSHPPISIYGTNTISKYELIKKILLTNGLYKSELLKPIKTQISIDRSLYLGENNLGDIYYLLKEFKEFEKKI